MEEQAIWLCVARSVPLSIGQLRHNGSFLYKPHENIMHDRLPSLL